MAKATIAIDPVTRIEGHLKAQVVVENGKVVDAPLTGGMFRGFEQILKGRDPRDSTQIVQRICGVCPTSHAMASALAQESAFNIKVTGNGRITRNLILGANYLQSHILHFYHLAALDFVADPDTAPFVPRFAQPDLRLPPEANKVGVDQYLEALEVRRIAHEMVALFGGRMPHVQGIVPGGATEMPTKEALLEYAARFKKVRQFIVEKYLPITYIVGSVYKDLFEQGQGVHGCSCFGVFPMTDDGKTHLLKAGIFLNGRDVEFDPKKITEDLKYAWYDDATTGKGAAGAETNPNLDKKDAYSFVKAPRYDGEVIEVGPAARMWVANAPLSEVGVKMLKEKFGIEARTIRDHHGPSRGPRRRSPAHRQCCGRLAEGSQARRRDLHPLRDPAERRRLRLHRSAPWFSGPLHPCEGPEDRQLPDHLRHSVELLAPRRQGPPWSSGRSPHRCAGPGHQQPRQCWAHHPRLRPVTGLCRARAAR